MQKVIALAGVICLLGVGMINADLISSSIATDGTAWVASAVLGDKTYAATIFTNDYSMIAREIDFSQDVQAQTQVKSSGPVGVHEFSAQIRTTGKPDFSCIFAERAINKTRYDEIGTLGLWSNGTYISSRLISGGQTVSLTDIEGTGMVSLRKGTDTSNLSQRERSFVAGHMNISEAVEFGEDEP